jgi:tRNA-modifying protein YgfZ
MSRLKNLGQVRRRLFVVRGTGELPASRASLFQGEQRVGELRSVAPHEGGFVAFAMLSLMQLDRGRRLSLSPGGSEDISVADHG